MTPPTPLLLLAGLLGGSLLLGPAPVPGQEAPKPPEEVAEEYLRGIEAMAWKAVAQRLHTHALARVRELLEVHLESDREEALLGTLSEGEDRETYLRRDAPSLFVSVMRALSRESPGLINAMTVRRTGIVGVVAEGDTLAHAVYRLRWELSGARPEMKVLTLALDGSGRWRVQEAPELQSLGTALQGLGRTPRPPP